MKRLTLYYAGERYIVFYYRDVYGEVVLSRIEHSKTSKNVSKKEIDIWAKAREKLK